MNKILGLSIAVLVLSVFNIFGLKSEPSKLYNAMIYIEGDTSSLTRVADLLVDYDRSNFELVSMTSGGFLTNSTIVQNENWDKNRGLLMSTAINDQKPALLLTFKSKKNNDNPNVRLSPDSVLYLANLGPVYIPSDSINYRVSYE